MIKENKKKALWQNPLFNGKSSQGYNLRIKIALSKNFVVKKYYQ